LDATNWSLANPLEFSKELDAEKPAKVYACIVLPSAELPLRPRASAAATVAVASTDIPLGAMSDDDDNDDVVSLDSRRNEKDTPVVLPDEYASFADVFSEEKASQPPELPDAEHEINTGDNKVPFGRLYNLSDHELGQLRDYLAEAEAKGWIRPSVSPAGSPIIFVPKKNGKLHLCVDYHRLNAVTIKNCYPLPLVSEILDRLVGAKYYTSMDLKDAYHCIRLPYTYQRVRPIEDGVPYALRLLQIPCHAIWLG